MSDLLAGLLDLLFPGGCHGCRGPVGHGRLGICPGCRERLLPLPDPGCATCGEPLGALWAPEDPAGIRCGACRAGERPWDEARSFGPHEDPLRGILLALKIGGLAVLAGEVARTMAGDPRVLSVLGRAEVLIPVPMTRIARLGRGFNHAEAIARALGEETGLPVGDALRKVRRTPPQHGLDAAQRRRSLRGAFALRPGVPLEGRRVCLVDDVWTTGSTADEACRVLREAGPARISVLTASRTIRRAGSLFPVGGRSG